MRKFEIYECEIEYDPPAISKRESDGRFMKYWIERSDLGRCLFKAATPFDKEVTTGRMDWREKVAEELGKLIELPVARTELAIARIPQRNRSVPGSISLDYTPDRGTVLSLRDFLSQVDPEYDRYDLNLEEGYNVGNAIGKAISGIFHRLPDPLVDDRDIEFAIGLLEFNRQELGRVIN